MIGYLTSKLFVQKLPRKKGMLVLVLISTGLGMCFLFEAVSDNKFIQTAIAGITRCTCSFYCILMMMMVTETFDRKVESVAIGLVVGGGSSGKLVVPFLVGAMNDIGVEPIIASSILFFILGFMPALLVKETYDP